MFLKGTGIHTLVLYCHLTNKEGFMSIDFWSQLLAPFKLKF